MREVVELAGPRYSNGGDTNRGFAYCVGEPFGLKRFSVSRCFIKESAAKLRELNKRDLSSEEIIAIFLDGKRFAKAGIMIALGVTLSGKEIVFGIIESATENCQVCKDFLEGLITRGLKVDYDRPTYEESRGEIKKLLKDKCTHTSESLLCSKSNKGEESHQKIPIF